MRRSGLSVLALLMAFGAGCSRESRSDGAARLPLAPGLAARVDALIGDYVAAHPVAGMAVAVAWQGQTLLSKGYGLADVEAKVPVDQATVFAIGSMTKQFTAAAILQLVDAGKLSLDADVRTVLPDAHLAYGPVTIRQLLSHTTGIPEYMPTTAAEQNLVFSPIAKADLVKRFAGATLNFTPGSNWAYSNSNFYLLALVVEKVSGETYEAYLQKHIFDQVGLEHTYACDRVPAGAPFAKGYVWDATTGKPVATRDVDMSWAFGAGNLCATAVDVLAWNAALQRGDVVSAAGLKTMETAVALTDGTPTTYSTGLFVDEVQGHRHIEHAGDTLTFSSDMAFYPDDGLAIVLTTNTEGARFDRFGLERSIGRAVLGLPEPAVQDKAVPAELGTLLTGTYAFPGEAMIRPNPVSVDVAAGKLELKDGTHPVALKFQGGRQFVVGPQPQMSFVFADGDASFVEAYQYEMMLGRALRAP